MSCGSGSNDQTVTQKTQVPASVSQGIDTLMSKGIAAANTPFQAYTGPRNAPFSPDQLAGFGAAEGAATAYQPWMNVAGQNLTAGAAPVTTGTFNQAAFDQYGSPYQQDVIDQTMQELQRQNQIQGNNLDSKATMAGAFGGDRAGIERTEQDRNNSQVMGQTLAGLNNQNWQQSQAQFNTDQARGLAAAQGNQQARLTAAQSAGNLGYYDQSMGLAGANALLGVGGQQQQQVQGNLNTAYNDFLTQQAYPWQQVQNLAGAIHGYPSPSTTSTTSPGPSVAGQVGGALTAGVGLLGATGAFGSNGWLHFNRGGLASAIPRRGSWRFGYQPEAGGGFKRQAWAPGYASGGQVPQAFQGLPMPGGDDHHWQKALNGYIANNDVAGYTAYLQGRGLLPASSGGGSTGGTGGGTGGTGGGLGSVPPPPPPPPAPTTNPYPFGPPVGTNTLPPANAAFYGPGVTGAGNPDVDAMRLRMATAGDSGLGLARGGRVAMADGGGLNFNPGNDPPMTDYSRLPAHSLAYMAQQGDRLAAQELMRRGTGPAFDQRLLPNAAPTALERPGTASPVAPTTVPVGIAAARGIAPPGLPSAGQHPTGLATATGPLAPAFRGDPYSGPPYGAPTPTPSSDAGARGGLGQVGPGTAMPPEVYQPPIDPGTHQRGTLGQGLDAAASGIAYGAKRLWGPSEEELTGVHPPTPIPPSDPLTSGYDPFPDDGGMARGATPASGLPMPASGLAAASFSPDAQQPTGIAAAAFAPPGDEGDDGRGTPDQTFTPADGGLGDAPPPADPAAATNTGLKAALQAPKGANDVPKWAMPMMMAGFAMMASRSPHLLSAVGEGGLAGMQSYTQQIQRDAENRRYDIAQQRADQQWQVDNRRADLQQQHNNIMDRYYTGRNDRGNWQVVQGTVDGKPATAEFNKTDSTWQNRPDGFIPSPTGAGGRPSVFQEKIDFAKNNLHLSDDDAAKFASGQTRPEMVQHWAMQAAEQEAHDLEQNSFVTPLPKGYNRQSFVAQRTKEILQQGYGAGATAGGGAGGAAGSAGAPAGIPTAPAAAAVRVSNAADYAKVPRGGTYIDPNGVVRVKP